MASNEKNLISQLQDMTECSICLTTFTDPRMLPCIHTFCCKCLENIAEKENKQPGQALQCPFCRTPFTIPQNGIAGLKVNFFVNKLVTMTKLSQEPLSCVICKESSTEAMTPTPIATDYCIECQDNLCDECANQHTKHKPCKSHRIVKAGSHLEEDFVKKCQGNPVNGCNQHGSKPLDAYCLNCDQLVCILCLTGNHNGHKVADANDVLEKFSKQIARDMDKVSGYEPLSLRMMKQLDEEKENYLKNIEANESAIVKKSNELKDLIELHKVIILNELSSLKTKRLKEIEIKREELEKQQVIMESFRRFCKEIISKGSPEDICRMKNELKKRADELVTWLMKQDISVVRVFFEPCNESTLTQNTTERQEETETERFNVIGNMKVETKTVPQLEDRMICFGVYNDKSCDINVLGIDLLSQISRSSRVTAEVTILEKIPVQMTIDAAAAVFNNKIFVTGVGEGSSEIWRYGLDSGWLKCGSLIQRRRTHCVTFIDETLYVSAGCDSDTLLDSIEAFDALTGECKLVGHLVHCVKNAACVPYKGSIYVFGGNSGNGYQAVDYVQVYDPSKNTCTLLSNKLPRPCCNLRHVLWGTNAVLVNNFTYLIFDFEKRTWKKMAALKANVIHFGMALKNNNIFIFGGGSYEPDNNDATHATGHCIDDVRYARGMCYKWLDSGYMLPRPCLVLPCGNITLVSRRFITE